MEIEEMSLPALLRTARHAYGEAVRGALIRVGFDDVPANGSFVLSGIARTGAPLQELVGRLGVSKQAAGQLVDTLVVRGYLERTVDPADRRRLSITLTDRGSAAAAAVRGAVEEIDTALRARVGAEHVTHTKATLAALGTLGASGA